MKKIFDFKHFKGDLFGGLTAGIVALPLALAFGVSSGLGPSAGLYGAIFVSFFAALFGGTNTQISGPTAPMTAVSMVVIAGIIVTFDGNVANALPAILTVFMLAGLIQIGLGFMGLGKYIKYIPYPVVSGFMTAIGVIILVTQLIPAIGYVPSDDAEYVETFKVHAEEVILNNILLEEEGEGILVIGDLQETINRAQQVTEIDILAEAKSQATASAKGVLGSLRTLPRAIQFINWIELMLALGTIIIIYGFKKITTAVPSTLIALLVMSGIAVGFSLDYRAIEAIPSGLPIPNWGIFTEFNFRAIMPYILTAFTLALLGAIDSLLTSIVADNMTKTRHEPNKELVGQGIGNTIAAIFGGIPGAGATIRTVVNIKAGGKTRLSGMMAGVLLLVILLALGPIASQIPAAVLAGILITVGIGVMDYKGLKAIPKIPKSEVVIMLVVLVLSSVWNLVYAVGIGLIISSLVFMKNIADIGIKRSSLKPLSTRKKLLDRIAIPEHLKEEVFVKLISGPLFFASTKEFQELVGQVPATATTVIFKCEKMEYIDQSGLYAFEDALTELVIKNKKVLFVNILEQPRLMMERIGIIPELVSDEFVFDNIDSCLNWVVANVKDVVQPIQSDLK